LASTVSVPPPVALVGRQGAGFWHRLRHNPLSAAGGIAVLVLVLAAVLAPLIAPHDFAALNLRERLLAPGAGHLLGTDQFGRDLFSRVIFGARISLLVGIVSTAAGGALGVVVGVVAGYLGGWIDEVLMRAMDVLMSFPQIVLAIALAAVLGPSLTNVILIVGLLQIPQFARVIRGSVLVTKEMDFVVAARTLGRPEPIVVLRHIVPNTLGPLIVLASLTVPTAILSETVLSFLGLGVDPTATPSWGSLLSDGRKFMLQAPWMATFPGLAITLAVLAFNFLGDGIRDAMDTRTNL
jgi:peptide/nickel transport system permease protein